MSNTAPRRTSTAERLYAALLVVGGTFGLLASSVLLIERVLLAEDPGHTPSCSLNPVLACGPVMASEQGALFGFPNPILGVAGFAVVLTTGMGLAAGAQYARWYWAGLQAGTVFGLGFVAWLAHQSLYAINALCIYCMAVWAVMIPVFWYTTLRNLRSGVFGERAASSRASHTLRDYQLLGPLLGYVTVLGAITVRFWDYWSTLL